MFAFAGTLFLMVLYNLGAGGVGIPNVLVGMLIFAGGVVLLLVALLEYIRGNSLYATCKLPSYIPTTRIFWSRYCILQGFITFSTFWLSYGAVLVPSFGVLEAFATDPSQIGRALGLYLFVWFITITMLLIGVIGKSKLFTILLSFASSGVLLLACAQFTGNKTYVPILSKHDTI
jgi:uncharacterized protein